MNRLFRLAILLLALWAAPSVQAFWSPLFSDYRRARTRPAVEMQADPTGRMTVEEAVKGTWSSTDTRVDPNSPLWLRVTVRNPTAEVQPALLEYMYMEADYISLFIPERDGKWTEIKSGEAVPITQRAVQCLEPIFYVPLGPHEEKTVYFRIQDPYFASPIVFEWNPPQRFFEARLVHEWLIGVYFGIVAVLVLTNLFTWVGLRERLYLYYVGYVACFALFVFVCSGYDELFFPWLAVRPMIINDHFFVTLAWTFFVLFALEFMEVRARFPKLERVIFWAAIIWCVHAPVYLTSFSAHHWILGTHMLIVIGMMTSMAGLAITLAIMGSKPARMFLLAYSAFFVTQVWLLLSLTGILPSTDVSGFHISIAGICFEVIVFTIVLSGRVRVLREQKESLFEQVAGADERYAAQLEETVQRRTQELVEREKEKDQLVSLLSHDLKGLVAASLQAGKVLHAGGLEEGEMKEIAGDLVEANSQIQRLTGEVLEWAKSRLDRTHALREADLNALLRDAAAAHAMVAANKQVRLQAELAPGAVVIQSDPGVISAVVRNFIANAIRHSPLGGEVVFGYSAEGSMRRVYVRDKGAGLSGDLARAIETGDFTSVRAASTSTGLGLMLCRELLASLGSKIECGNHAGGGAEFSFRV